MTQLSLLLGLVAFAQQDPAPLEQRVHARLKELHAAGEFPGMTAAYVLPNGNFVQIGIGFDDLAAQKPMKAGARMFSGSIGKTYVSALAMKLVEEKKLGLDDPISKYIGSKPYFDRIPNAKLLTVRHLMNHTSGIREHVLNPTFVKAMKDDPDRTFTPDELAAYALDTTPLFEPGKQFGYADTNYNFLGLILESITAKPVFADIRERILNPLQLNNTTPSDSRSPAGLAQGHSMPNSPFGFTGPVIKDGKYPFNPQMEYCGGGFVSNSLDLALWAKQLFESKAYDASLMIELLKGERANTGPNEKYGLGVQVRPSDWGETWGHSGWFPGYLSDMAYFPHKKFSVAVQFNTDHGAKLKMRPYRYVLEIAKLVEADLK